MAVTPDAPTLLDRLLPSYDHRTMHGRGVDAPVERVTGLDVNRSYAAVLERATEVSAERIVAAVKKVMYREEGT